MAGLTVTEKEHWKSRIANRIEKQIEAIGAADPNLMGRIQHAARLRALESLGLASLQAELHEIERQKQVLDQRDQAIDRAMLAQVRGVPITAIEGHCYHSAGEIEKVVARRQAVHEDELLAENETGRKILALRREQENLLDTVWLATCPGELKTLWAKVTELLGDERTPLEREALAIQPPAV